jgi:hypothetical protein
MYETGLSGSMLSEKMRPLRNLVEEKILPHKRLGFDFQE